MKVIYVNRRGMINSRFRSRISFFNPNNVGPRTESFFSAALHSAFDVTEVGIDDVLSNDNLRFQNAHIIVVTVKAVDKDNYSSYLFKELSDRYRRQIKVLAVLNDQAFNMPPDSTLNHFDFIVKREPLLDRNRYKISNHNKEKIIPTIIGCNAIYKKILKRTFGLRNPPSKIFVPNYAHDVFFSGKSTSKLRENCIKAIKDSSIQFYGGLQKSHLNFDKNHYFTSLMKKEFYKTIRESKINLALDGAGEFTFRHLDILWLAGFALCYSSIRDLDLVIGLKEYDHFISFRNKDDLIDKVQYYLNHDSEREKIALQGHSKFEKDYDFIKHGLFLKARIC